MNNLLTPTEENFLKNEYLIKLEFIEEMWKNLVETETVKKAKKEMRLLSFDVIVLLHANLIK